MPLKDLSAQEKQVVCECLIAASEGPFFPEWEFHILFGLKRADVAQVASACPMIDEAEQDVRLAINNSMNHLLGYPHKRQDVWFDYISVSSIEVRRIFYKWRGDRPRRYFDSIQ